MRVGLNNFLRFISANGLSKVNQVTEASQEYLPGRDYYKPFREEAIRAIASRKTAKLERLVASVPDQTKALHYDECLRGLLNWMASTDYEVIGHPRSHCWNSSELKVAVNPELTIKVDGVFYIVKLYAAKGKLSRPAMRAYAWLVEETHGRDALPALLELRKARLAAAPRPNNRIGQWIRGEVAAFIALWKMNKAA